MQITVLIQAACPKASLRTYDSEGLEVQESEISSVTDEVCVLAVNIFDLCDRKCGPHISLADSTKHN